VEEVESEEQDKNTIHGVSLVCQFVCINAFTMGELQKLNKFK